MPEIAVVLSVAAIISAASVIIYDRIKMKNTFVRIDKMLDSAADGTFSENDFDESVLSALEARFADFVSASVRSENNIRKEKEKIRSLISDISHQTKTPVANLLLYCELLEEEGLSPSAAEYTDALYSQAEKLRFLIDGLVKLSRLENGILVLSPVVQECDPMLESVCLQYASAAERKGIDLICEKSGSSACFDFKWTSEALCNIIDNAVKYTENGTVKVSAVTYEMFLRIDVSDTGPGIPEEEQAKIFTRFYRSPLFSQKDGAGIGLHLAREIISVEGGYIKVSSDPGKGTVFSVFLPKQKKHDARPSDVSPAHANIIQ